MDSESLGPSVFASTLCAVVAGELIQVLAAITAETCAFPTFQMVSKQKWM